MKKRKIIAAAVAVMAAASMSATDVYAAKADKADKDKITFSGSTKTEVKETKSADKGQDTRKTKWKSSVKLNTNVKADDRTEVMLGVNYENKSEKEKNVGEEGMELEFENIWVETKMNDNLKSRFGAQSIGLANGLTLDADGILGGKFTWKPDKNNALQLFIGRDGFSDLENEPADEVDLEARDIHFVDFKHKFGNGSIGSYYMQQEWNYDDGKGTYRPGKQKYFGVYGDYDLAEDVNLSGEWVKNSHTSKHGYIAQLEMGPDKNVGDLKYALTYINAPQFLYPSDDYTDYDDLYKTKNGFKGLGLTTYYKLTKASTLSIEKFWGDTHREDKSKNVNFDTLKLKLAVKF